MLFMNAPPVATTEEMLALENRLGIKLPHHLTLALPAQNGGRLLGTVIDIYPISYFATLNEGEWSGLALPEVPEWKSRERLICVGRMPGGSVVLDYRSRASEPRIRNMDHIFNGEVRAEFDSFDVMIRASLQSYAPKS